MQETGSGKRAIRLSRFSAGRSAEPIYEVAGANAMDQLNGHHWVDPNLMAIPIYAVAAMPAALAREENVIPVALAGRMLTVAVADPMDFELIDKLRFVCNLQVETVTASANAIRCAVARSYGEASDTSFRLR
jgi:type IV pilus assembly protein PilB